MTTDQGQKVKPQGHKVTSVSTATRRPASADRTARRQFQAAFSV